MSRKNGSLGCSLGSLRRKGGGAVLLLFLFGFLGWGEVPQRVGALLSRTQIGAAFLRSFSRETGTFWPLNGLVWVGVVVGSTFLAGRWYCAVLCPLGTLQQALVSRRPKGQGRIFQDKRREKALQYGLGAVVTLSAAAGTLVLVNLLDPYGLTGRVFRDMAMPLLVFLNRILYQIFRWFDLYFPILPFEPDIPVFFFTLTATLLLGWVTQRRGRVYCGTLCPVGTFLSFCSKAPLYRVRVKPDLCSQCGLCVSSCPTGALAGDGQQIRVEHSRCVLCGNCLEVCPRGAIRFGGSVEKAPRGPVLAEPQGLVSRRLFLKKAGKVPLALGIGALLGAVGVSVASALGSDRFRIRKRGTTPAGDPNLPCSPPGSLGIERFSSLCVSCHLCVSHCPTAVLSPALWEYGLKGLFQPVMDYRQGFCAYECVRCGQVCPTGAILPLGVEEKKSVQVGKVRFERERCVVVSKGTICGACAEVCPTHAVGMVPYGKGLDIPATDNALCVGCGSCEYACPVPQKAIFVEGLPVHGKAEVRKPSYEAPREPAKKEFPF